MIEALSADDRQSILDALADARSRGANWNTLVGRPHREIGLEELAR